MKKIYLATKFHTSNIVHIVPGMLLVLTVHDRNMEPRGQLDAQDGDFLSNVQDGDFKKLRPTTFYIHVQ